MRRAAILLFAALLAACGSAPRRDLDFDRLHASLQALATDPELAKLALAERALAEAAVRRLDASSINAKEHAQLSYLAERRVDIAYIAAQTEQEKARLTQLQREHAELLLAASRRETEAVRAELDRQRRDALLQQEEAERGGATAPPAGTAATIAAETKSAPPAAPVSPPPPTAPAATTPAVSLPDVDVATGTAAASAAAAGTPVPPAADGSRAGAAAQEGSTLAAAPATAQGSAPPSTQPAAQDSATQPAAASTTPSASTSPAPASPSAPVQPSDAAATAPAPASAAPGSADATNAAADLPLAQRLATLTPDADSGGAQLTLEDLVFEPGTATFAAGAEVGLARVAAWLAAAPAQAVRIEGHTDATGSPEANLSLSLRRAEAVRDAVIARGVAAARIVVSGEGAADPVASNDDAQGRARNRRVVVRLLDGG